MIDKKNRKKMIIIGLIILLFLGSIQITHATETYKKTTSEPIIFNGTTYYVDADAPPEWYDEYHVHTITEAHYKAVDGDTIFVHTGWYFGVHISKSIQFIGEDRELTELDLKPTIISSNHTTMSGFKVYERLEITGHNITIDNNIIDTIYSLVIQKPNTIITNNIFTSPIQLRDEAHHTYIANNTITIADNSWGLSIDSSHNIITHNTITDPINAYRLRYPGSRDIGIQLYRKCTNNTITYNTLKYWYIGINNDEGRGNNFSYNNFIFIIKPIRYSLTLYLVEENLTQLLTEKRSTWYHNYYNIPYPIPKPVYGRFQLGYSNIRFRIFLFDKKPAITPNKI